MEPKPAAVEAEAKRALDLRGSAAELEAALASSPSLLAAAVLAARQRLRLALAIEAARPPLPDAPARAALEASADALAELVERVARARAELGGNLEAARDALELVRELLGIDS